METSQESSREGNKKSPAPKGRSVCSCYHPILPADHSASLAGTGETPIPCLCNGRTRAASLFGTPGSEAIFRDSLRAPFHQPELSLAYPSAYSSLHCLSEIICTIPLRLLAVKRAKEISQFPLSVLSTGKEQQFSGHLLHRFRRQCIGLQYIGFQCIVFQCVDSQ